ncbi:MAG: hypothetical protein A2172_01730 [Candidatus Woykebacteria bacterium RBG_13_40_15]|uniref:Core-binding (CB) domain-containing protein n=1 Tax=Candidatus Woykebacteria bacterium RBG_13_40_15 TaxID=1802593 RepID=A0A1G1W9U4_9BACT|nr:MAG: hypothetical protein A2172_01730 [Candidatus Woykebacteria bacterium RBG_13_40_15]
MNILPNDDPVGGVVFKYKEYLKQSGYSTPTVKNYLSDLRYFCDWLKNHHKDLFSLTKGDLDNYQFHLSIIFKNKPSINSRKASSLRGFLSWATKEQILSIQETALIQTESKLTSAKKLTWFLSLISFKPARERISHFTSYRPDWYHRYHRWSFAATLHYIVLISFLVVAGGSLIYFYIFRPEMNQTKKEFVAELGSVLAASPPKILSFQGRLTNPTTGQPIIIATNIVFRIYTSTSGDTGSPCANTCKWESKTWSVTPDANGIFSVTLGDTGASDTEIPDTLFTDNPTLYLGVKVGADAEMAPRQRIASSSYALNSDALEGFHGSQSPGANQVPILDGSGNLMFAGAATIGTSANALTLDSASGTLALGSGTTTISSAGALTLNSTTSSAVTLDSSTTGTINIGNNANAKTINIGNATDTTLVNIDSGTSGVTIDSTGTGDILVNSTDTLLLDSAGVLELNSSAGVISIGNDAVAQNINIGTGAAARTITIGNTTTTTGIVLTKGASGEITLTGYDATCTALETDADGHLNCGTDDGGGGALHQITAATGDNSINNAAWNQVWNWQLAGAESGFKFAENAASTGGGTNDQFIVDIATLATSTAGPLRVTSNSIDTSDIVFNLNSLGDIEIQDAGAAFATFADDGTITLGKSAAASAINIGTGTAGNTIYIGTDNSTKDTISIGSALDDVAITGDDWSMTNAGVLQFGATGSYDTNLYRSAANTLKTDDSIISAGLASVSGSNSVSNVPYNLLTDKATTNRVVNPSFEVNVTDGWQAYGGAVAGDLSQNATPYVGTYSMRIYKTGAAINDGAQTTTMPVSASTKYVASVFVIAVSGSPTFKISLTGDNSGQTQSGEYTARAVTRWQRFFVYKQSNSSDTTFTFEIYSSAAQNFYIYVDAVQLEQVSCNKSSCATSYADGSLGPEYAWTGTAHNSSSTRTTGIKYLGGGTSGPDLYIGGGAYFEGGSGDIDLNGTINATDSSILSLYFLGTQYLSPNQLAIADVSGDGKVSLDDDIILSSLIYDTYPNKYDPKRLIGNLYGAGTTTRFDVNGDMDVTGSTITFGSFASCGALSTNSSGALVCNTGTGDTATFTDASPGVVADSDATEMFNDATRPNITPNSATQTVLVHASVRLDASGIADAIAAFRIVREDDGGSTTPVCDGTDPQVGNTMIAGDLLLSTDFSQAQATVLDAPASTAAVYYTVCTSTDTNMGANVPTATSVTVTLIELGADLAENYYTTDDSIAPGQIVSTDNSIPAGAEKTTRAYDSQILGVVSTAPGKILDDGLGLNFGRAIPVALVGRVPVKVNGENGPIAVGDLITSSSTPGVGMKATKAGYVIGRALTSFSGQGEGAVVAFVNTQYADPANLEAEGNLLDLTDSSSTPSAEATNSSSLKLDTENNIVATLSSGTRFVWVNSLGKALAWISDTGEAFFEKVTALVGNFQKLIFGELVASKDSQNAGQASFEPDQTEVVIESEKVTEDSLIYVTAATKTDGISLYIKEQRPGEGFTVALERSSGDLPNEATASATQAIKFNWLIINRE